MPSETDVDQYGVYDVVRRYHRRERLLSGLFAAAVVAAFLATLVLASLVPAALVALALVVLVRAPVLRSRGTVRLATDADPAAVVDALTGSTPPVLAFQWGVADAVETRGETAVYRLSYLFGLRSVEATVRAETDATADVDRRVELVVEMDGEPWATYTVTVGEGADGTVVEYEYAADRRFGLRRVPQRLVQKRYRDELLAAQGYTVVEREERFGP